MRKKSAADDSAERMRGIVESLTPLAEIFSRSQVSGEDRLKVFRDAFAMAENSKQRTALACAFLGGTKR